MTSRHPTMREVLAAHAAQQPLAAAPASSPGPRVVTISREPGARGREIANALGEQLGFRVYDREIIHRIAETSHVSEQVVSFLDEKPRSLLTDWISSIESDTAYLSPYAYFQHLVQAVTATARLGSAVILGRGAHLILGPGEALRVLVTAPADARLRTVAERDGVDLHEAKRRVALAEAQRRAFLARYFRAQAADPSAFDLVVNTAVLGVDGAVDVVRAALARLGERSSAQASGSSSDLPASTAADGASSAGVEAGGAGVAPVRTR